jgi:hypothetical protein
MKPGKNMIKLLTISFMAVLTLSLTLPTTAIAAPNENANDKAHEKATFQIPKNAVEIAPGIFSLGTIESNGLILEGIMSLHHRNGHTGGPGGDTSGETECYSYTFGKQLQWRELENWIVNPSNNAGLTQTEVMDTLNEGISEWESYVAPDILGIGLITTDPLVADYDSTDDQNEVYFADIRNSDGSPNSNILGVTITWAVVNGPPFAKGIVEMDQIYDDYDFEWSTDDPDEVEDGKFDFGSTATHEIGHGVGMGHAPAVEECILETMYPYGSHDDTSGRSLHDGDIAGIQKLY